MAHLLDCTDLQVGYYQEPVCGPITVTLAEGQILGVVGPNGSGKSTFVRTMLGLLEPLGGQMRVLGEEVDERSIDFRANVAAVLDDDAYFPALTVAEHLELTARGHGVANAREVVANALEFFGIASHGDADPAELSSGQRRRTLLAGAFVRPFALLVLDEPEQRLDTAMRTRLAQRLQDSADEGAGILLVSHDPELVRSTAHAVLALSDAPAQLVAPAAAEQYMGQR